MFRFIQENEKGVETEGPKLPLQLNLNIEELNKLLGLNYVDIEINSDKKNHMFPLVACSNEECNIERIKYGLKGSQNNLKKILEGKISECQAPDEEYLDNYQQQFFKAKQEILKQARKNVKKIDNAKKQRKRKPNK